MLLEAIAKPVCYCLRSGQEIVLRPGQPVELPDEQARKLLEKAPGKVRAVLPPAQPPDIPLTTNLAPPFTQISLSPGWTVAYWDSNGKLRDGVIASHDGHYVRLTSGKLIPIQAIKSASDGQVAPQQPDTPQDTSAPLPDGYCPRCGSGYWIRPTQDAPWQCGRCSPSATRVDTLLVPGGTAPPLQPDRPAPSPVLVEPAVRPDGSPISPVYFERQGRIVGPAQPEFFFRDSSGQIGLIVRYENAPVSIDHRMLRSRRQFETQHPLRSTQTASSDPNACLSCGSRRRWRSIHGVTICVICHPPASLELVAEWIREA